MGISLKGIARWLWDQVLTLGITNVIGGLIVAFISGMLFAFGWVRDQLNKPESRVAKFVFKRRESLLTAALICGGIGGALVIVAAILGLLYLGAHPRAQASARPANNQTQALAPIPLRQPYRLTNNNLPATAQSIFRVSDNAYLPPANNEFLAWLRAGNIPDQMQATLPAVYAARSPYDANREIPIIDKLSETLRREAEPLLQNNLVGNWPDAFEIDKSPAYFDALTAYHDQFVKTNAELAEMTQQIPQFCDDDLCVIVDTSKSDDAAQAIANFKNLLTKVRNVIDFDKFTSTRKNNQFSDVLEPQFESFANSMTAYRIWVFWAERQLSYRRNQLSQIASRE